MTLPTPPISPSLKKLFSRSGSGAASTRSPSQWKARLDRIHRRRRPGEHRLEHDEQDAPAARPARRPDAAARHRPCAVSGSRSPGPRTAAASRRSASRWPTRKAPASGGCQSATRRLRRCSSSRRSIAGQQRIGAAAPHRHRFHDRHAELARQALDVDLDAALAGDVHHVERQHHRPADALQLERQPQRQPQVGGVGDADDQVGRDLALEAAQHDIARDLLVGRARAQANRCRAGRPPGSTRPAGVVSGPTFFSTVTPG